MARFTDQLARRRYQCGSCGVLTDTPKYNDGATLCPQCFGNLPPQRPATGDGERLKADIERERQYTYTMVPLGLTQAGLDKIVSAAVQEEREKSAALQLALDAAHLEIRNLVNGGLCPLYVYDDEKQVFNRARQKDIDSITTRLFMAAQVLTPHIFAESKLAPETEGTS